MSWIKALPVITFLTVGLFVFADNLFYELQVESNMQDMSLDFRHSAFEDYVSVPSPNYVSISNSSLDTSPNRFRTGAYGEVLYTKFQKSFYDAKCKFLFIGGSSTETRWVKEDERWVALIDQSFREDGTKRVAFNFGVGGQNLAQSLNRFNSFIYELKPEFVFIMHEANDLSKFIKGGYQVPEGSLHNLVDRKKSKPSFPRRIRDFVKSLLPFTTEIWRSYSNMNVPPRREVSKSIFKGLKPEKAADQYLGRLLAINELVKAYGGQLVLIQYPETYKAVLNRSDEGSRDSVRDNLISGLQNNGMTGVEFLNYVSDFRLVLNEGAMSNGIDVIKTTNWLETDDYYDAIHFNRSGASKFANLMLKKLQNYRCQN